MKQVLMILCVLFAATGSFAAEIDFEIYKASVREGRPLYQEQRTDVYATLNSLADWQAQLVRIIDAGEKAYLERNQSGVTAIQDEVRRYIIASPGKASHLDQIALDFADTMNVLVPVH